MSERRALCVVGMHRSGTSLTSELLCAAGATAPAHVSGAMYADQFNERGYWESLALKDLNNAFLSEIGMSWDSALAIPAEVAFGTAAQRYRAQLIRILREEYEEAQLFSVKDPRFSRFLPHLASALRSESVEPIIIVAIRNPLEIAESLKRRDGLHYAKSLLLWMRHILDAERDSRAERRVFIHYEQLIADWRAVLQRIALAGDFTWELPDETARAIDATVAARLRHFSSSSHELKSRTDLSTWIYELYAACVDASNGAVDLAAFDRIRERVDNADKLLAPLMISGYELQLLDRAK